MEKRKFQIKQILLLLIPLSFLIFEIFILAQSKTRTTLNQIINALLFFSITSVPFVSPVSFGKKPLPGNIKSSLFKRLLSYTTFYSLLLLIVYTYFDVPFIDNYIETFFLISILFYTIIFSFQLNFSKEKNKIFNKNDLFLIIPLLIFFTASFCHLGKFFSVDEYKWLYERVPQYIEAWKTHNWEETFVNDKPGILTTALSSITFNHFNILELLRTSDIEGKAYLLSLWRLPIIIFNTISLCILYFSAKSLTSLKSSLLFIFFISITPILIGISQVVNPDATLWICSIISMISFIGAVKKKSFSLLTVSGIYLGFSFLSKYFAITTLLIIIAFPLIKFLEDYNSEDFRRNLSYSIFSITTATGIFCIFCPKVLLNPQTLYDVTIASPITKYFTSILIALLILYFSIPLIVHKIKEFNYIKIINIVLALVIFILFVISLTVSFKSISSFNLLNFFYENAKRKDETFFNILIGSSVIQIYTNLIITTPLFLLSLLKTVRDSLKNNLDSINSLLLTAILINLTGPAFGGFIPIPRYEICLYPLIIFFICRNLFENISLIKYISLLVITLITSIDVFYTVPYYLQYTNYLGVLNPSYITEPWGFGGYEIAEYITRNIDSDEMIWTDREGICIFISNPCRVREWNPFLSNYDFKYMVLTNTGYSRTISSDDTYTEETKDLWEEYYFRKEYIYKRYLLPKSKLFVSKIIKIEEKDKIENTE